MASPQKQASGTRASDARRPLGDIGNVDPTKKFPPAADKKLVTGIGRPVTRSMVARLLVDAQKVNGRGKRDVDAKAQQNLEEKKPRTLLGVITRSKAVCMANGGQKNSQALTGVITRSKAVCMDGKDKGQQKNPQTLTGITTRSKEVCMANSKETQNVTGIISRSKAVSMASSKDANGIVKATQRKKRQSLTRFIIATSEAFCKENGKDMDGKDRASQKKPETLAGVITGSKEVCEKTDVEDDGDQRTKRPALTALITARSEAVCRESSASDTDKRNPLMVTDYVADIYDYYKDKEEAERPGDYLRAQPDINEHMRMMIVEWTIEVHQKFHLQTESLYLAIYIFDRFLTLVPVVRWDLQLIAIAAMLVATKYEEVYPPEVNDFIRISGRPITGAQIREQEKMILGKLGWNLTVPTSHVFLLRFLKAAKADREMSQMARFLTDLSLTRYEMITVSPSILAAAAIYAANCTLKRKPIWSVVLLRHTTYCDGDIRDCARQLLRFHRWAKTNKSNIVYKKYSSSQFGAVATKSPALIPRVDIEDVD